MGYSTDFSGAFNSDVEMSDELVEVINAFSEMNHYGEDGKPDSRWCDFEVSKTQLYWNQSEKTRCYVEWLEYLVKHFFEPNGVKLSGVMNWQGDDEHDIGHIIMVNNAISVRESWDNEPKARNNLKK